MSGSTDALVRISFQFGLFGHAPVAHEDRGARDEEDEEIERLALFGRERGRVAFVRELPRRRDGELHRGVDLVSFRIQTRGDVEVFVRDGAVAGHAEEALNSVSLQHVGQHLARRHARGKPLGVPDIRLVHDRLIQRRH
jgi:hypothetical protein